MKKSRFSYLLPVDWRIRIREGQKLTVPTDPKHCKNAYEKVVNYIRNGVEWGGGRIWDLQLIDAGSLRLGHVEEVDGPVFWSGHHALPAPVGHQRRKLGPITHPRIHFKYLHAWGVRWLHIHSCFEKPLKGTFLAHTRYNQERKFEKN